MISHLRPVDPSDDYWTRSSTLEPELEPEPEVATANGETKEPKSAEAPPKIGAMLDAAFATAERRRTGEEKPVPVPWPEYGEILGGGFWPGVHTCIGGTGVGKSQNEFQIALHAAKHGVPVYYIGLELSEFQVAMRACSEAAGIGWSRFYTGQASDRDMQQLTGVRPAVADLPLYIELGQAHGWAVSRMLPACEAIRREHPNGPFLVVLDFLQLVAGDMDDRGRTPDLRERIARAAYAAVHIANRYGASVKLVSSAARDKYALLASDAKGCGLGVFKGKKTLASPEALIGLGKESGEIEYAVETQTVLIRWPSCLDNGDKLIIAAVPKLRYGPPSWTALAFGRRFSEFRVADMSELPVVTKGGSGAVAPDEYASRIIATVQKCPGLDSASKIVERTAGRKGEILASIKELLADGALIRDGKVFSVPTVGGGDQ